MGCKSFAFAVLLANLWALAQLPQHFDEIEHDYDVVDISEDGFRIWGRSLGFEEAQKIDPAAAGSLSHFVIDPMQSFTVLGREVYIQEDDFFAKSNTHRYLFVVDPRDYAGPILALRADSFAELLDGPHTMLVATHSGDYFQSNSSAEPTFEYRNRLIDPHSCENDTPPSGEVHHVDNADPDSDCHGEEGETGSCDGSNDNGHYYLTCFTITGVNGTTKERCYAKATCANGGTPVGSSPPPGMPDVSVGFVDCSTATGGPSARAGITSSGVAFVDCGNGLRHELQCN